MIDAMDHDSSKWVAARPMGLAADVIAIRRRSLVVGQHGRRYRDFGRRLGSICYADLLHTHTDHRCQGKDLRYGLV